MAKRIYYTPFHRYIGKQKAVISLQHILVSYGLQYGDQSLFIGHAHQIQRRDNLPYGRSAGNDSQEPAVSIHIEFEPILRPHT